MLHLALALQLAAGASFTAEGWLDSHDGFAHRMIATADAELVASRLEIGVYHSIILWAASDTFPLMAQSGAALERQHGATVRLRLGPCVLGAWVGRRAVQGLNTGAPEWGVDLGYWDGVAPTATCRMDRLRVGATGPLQTWHFVHLPYPRYRMRIAYRQGAWWAVARGAFMAETHCTPHRCQGWRPGLDPGTEVDLTVGYGLGAHLDAGFAAGQLQRPGYGPPVRRFAVFIRVGS